MFGADLVLHVVLSVGGASFVWPSYSAAAQFLTQLEDGELLSIGNARELRRTLLMSLHMQCS